MSSLRMIALLGSPNSGKTTLFNWLTGSHSKIVNYPGATVDYTIGTLSKIWSLPSTSEQMPSPPPQPPWNQSNTLQTKSDAPSTAEICFMDTPGIYSLIPKSLDEEVTLKVLQEQNKSSFIQKIILVVDSTQLERNIPLIEQVRSLDIPFIIALTMKDLLLKHSIKIDREELSKVLNAPICLIDGQKGYGIQNLLNLLLRDPYLNAPSPKNDLSPWSDEDYQLFRRKSILIKEKCLSTNTQWSNVYKNTLKIDRVLLHEFLGPIFFVLIMMIVFSSVFWLATPFMDSIDWLFNQFSHELPLSFLPPLAKDFLLDGLMAGLGTVLVFVPQIFILFLGIGILESSGYLARAATIVDRPLSWIGLSGKSFIPLLSGFACAVPAMMASRNLSSKRDRWITNFIIPLMTCSARLPVYALLLSFVFYKEESWKPGLALSLIYFLSLFIGGICAGVLHHLLPKNNLSLFALELPMYRWPRWRSLFLHALQKTGRYVFQAGPIIFIFSLVLWGSSHFPNYELPEEQRFKQSYIAKAGELIEPLMKPLGLDWKVGVGLLSAFAAREVFVSSMAIIYQAESSSEKKEDSVPTENTNNPDHLLQESLITSMKLAKHNDGTYVFNFATVLGLMVFFMMAFQCMSTFSVSWRENGFLYAIFQLISMNLMGYVLAFSIYKIVQ